MDKKIQEKQTTHSVIELSDYELQESSLLLSAVAANLPWIWKMDFGNNLVETIVNED